MRTVRGDQTLALMREGYALLPNLRHQVGEDSFRTRLLGRPVACLCGAEAAKRFYDEALFVRDGALPGPVQRTLTGVDAVHTLGGAAHRHRKDMFLALKDPVAVKGMADAAAGAWNEAEPRWAATDPVVLFDEAAEVLTRAVCSWAGVPLAEAHARAASADMVAMVDGFGSPGPRHWRARVARRRAERRMTETVRRIRSGEDSAPAGSMFERVLQHREPDGDLLDSHMAAVETLNVLRPTVAVAWFMAFSAHALHRWPAHRYRMRAEPWFAASNAHEVRRFSPFAPFMGAIARRDVAWEGDTIEEGTLTLLDLFGHNHDDRLWDEPYAFRPERFLGYHPGEYDLVPQGAGDAAAGHRCPGEDIVVEVLKTLLPRLANLRYDLPPQDLSIPLSPMPTRPRSGVVMSGVRVTG